MNDTIGYLIDIDGVVRTGKTPIASGVLFVNYLIDNKIPYLFLTNNSTRSIKDAKEMLTMLGIRACVDSIVSSAIVTADYIVSQKKGATAYVVGESGLISTLTDNGIEISDNEPDYVVVGWDRKFSFKKIERAMKYIQEGSIFIATNTDATFPTSDGTIPGAGAIVASIEAASGINPIVMGKPSRHMFSYALKKIGLSKKHVYMVGDRIDTDIVGAKRAGLSAILVTTGISSREDVVNYEERPDLIVNSLLDLIGERT